jgi:hypothetical protein
VPGSARAARGEGISNDRHSPRWRPRMRPALAYRPACQRTARGLRCGVAAACDRMPRCFYWDTFGRTVVDEFTRECLTIDVAGSIRSARVIEVLVGCARRTDRNGTDRPGKAVAECHGRIVQREVSRRAPEPAVVPASCRSQGRNRAMAASLQRGSAAFEPRLPDAPGVQAKYPDANAEHKNGPDERRSPVIIGPKKPGRSAP